MKLLFILAAVLLLVVLQRAIPDILRYKRLRDM